MPINKRYDQLSAEEKAIINQWYERIEPGDEPPFPVEGLRPIHDAVIKAQAKLRVEGNLLLIATVDDKGDVTTVKAIGSPSPEMTKFAASVLLLTKFKPALCKGIPCVMDFPFTYSFTLGRWAR